MRVNYNKWFHEYNKYITMKSGDKIDYNDNSWVDFAKRLKTLNDLNSSLISEQPFGVVANRRGLLHLMDLLAKSSYSFEDVDQSLIDTYKTTLQASMSNMTVNTSAIMFSCKSDDRSCVSYDQISRYYIVDVPFAQLHFGDRDEFIRQKIEKMYTTAKNNYVDLNEFVSHDIESLLGFSIMCVVNGYICNDCKIAIDDRGFRFKVMWIKASDDNAEGDIEFTIYKLDTVKTHRININPQFIINNEQIPWDELNAAGLSFNGGTSRCIVDLYNPDYARTVKTAPNFAKLDENGLTFLGLQSNTIDRFKEFKSDKAVAIIYEMNYLHEVPDVFPAANYYDVLDDRRVYTEKAEGVLDVLNLKVVSSATYSDKTRPICTPPIVIDRESSNSFQLITQSVTLYNKLMTVQSTFINVGTTLKQSNEYIESHYQEEIIAPLTDVYWLLKDCFEVYKYTAILTSSVPDTYIDQFQRLVTTVTNIVVRPHVPRYIIDEDHSIFDYTEPGAYENFIAEITVPFNSENMGSFKLLPEITSNFFEKSEPTRFNRPISEHCFISMKYNEVATAWLFANPNIEHFKGIGNTFYIDDNLKGDEIFKFFVLYTDTGSPAETNVDKMTLEQVYDFDKFCDEVEKHMGYIKYWNAENKLMKLSKILYDDYNDETVVKVLGKILSGSIDVDDILNIYGTQTKYDNPGRSSVGWSNELRESIYTETSLAAPFTINYLFYTLYLMRDNEDKMEAYFMRLLTDKKFSRRYVDVNISDSIDKNITVPVNYSQYSIAPNTIDAESSVIPAGLNIYYGIPYSLSTRIVNTSNPYRYTFNIYDKKLHYPIITEAGVQPNGYLAWSDIDMYGGSHVKFTNDIEAAKLVSKYLTYTYTCISNIETNYEIAYDVRHIIDTYYSNLESITTRLRKMVDDGLEFQNSDTLDVINMILVNNPVHRHFNDICDDLGNIYITFQTNDSSGPVDAPKTLKIRGVIDELTKFIRQIYTQSGFNKAAQRRIKKMYKYLKKYNDKMSIQELVKWWDEFDFHEITYMETQVAKNDATTDMYRSYKSTLSYLATCIYQYSHVWLPRHLSDLSEKMNTKAVRKFWNSHFNICATFCKEVFTYNIFDMFAIKDIVFDDTETYSAKPYCIIANINSEQHTKSPIDSTSSDHNLVLYAESDVDGNEWKITDIIQVCEYCFFSGNTLTNVSAEVFDKGNHKLGDITLTFKFVKAGTTAGIDRVMNIIPSVSTTTLSFNNEHETMSVNDSEVVNGKTHDLHFELLFGNKYIPLEHDCEYVLNPVTYEEHSVDIVRIPNKLINSLMLEENSVISDSNMYFKPSQIYHLPIDITQCITSVYGRCFVGQTVYMASDDGLSVFPVTITAIDHSDAHGFVEAVIDSTHAKWFPTSSSTVINKYLFTDVTCHVIPDNMMNFVKEYNNPMYYEYNIPDIDVSFTTSPESLPGDPIFVTSNESYVFTRLNYMFHEDIDNRFIDNDKKSWKFIYLGEVVGKPSAELTDDVEISETVYQYQKLSYLKSRGAQRVITDIEVEGAKDPMYDALNDVTDYSYDGYTIFFKTEFESYGRTQPGVLIQIGDETTPSSASVDLVYDESTTRATLKYMAPISSGGEKQLSASGNIVADRARAHGISLYNAYGYGAWNDNGQSSNSQMPNNVIEFPSGPITIFGNLNDDTEDINALLYYVIIADNHPSYSLGSGSSISVNLDNVDTFKYSDNTFVYNHVLVPYMRVSDNVCGLLDERTGKFYTSESGSLSGYNLQNEWVNVTESVDDVSGETVRTIERFYEQPEPIETSIGLSESTVEPSMYDFTINLINRETHEITTPEMYPILRDEPNDHDIWEKELSTFDHVIEYELEPMKLGWQKQLAADTYALRFAVTDYDKNKLVRSIENSERKLADIENRIKQVKHYGEQLECASTWYNVRSYDAAMVYVENGRSVLDPSIIIDKRDIPITDKINVFLYDWEHKEWIDPSTYTIDIVRETINTDNKADYYTKDVMTKMVVSSEQGFTSGDIFVYVAYNKSDIYDSIPMNTNECSVKFKPVLSTAKATDIVPYGSINIRKHFDGYEEYHFTSFNASDKGFNDGATNRYGLYVERVNTSGKFMDTPILRIKDIKIIQDSNNSELTGFSIYKRIPFANIDSEMIAYEPTYTANVALAADNFTAGEPVKMICIENNNESFYDGTISNVMFSGETSIDEETGKQKITILNSSLEPFISGQYYCTIFQSNDYKTFGGIVSVNVHANPVYTTDASNDWVEIPINEKTRLMSLPKEFIIKPNNPESISIGTGVTVLIKSLYDSSSDTVITEDNSNDSSLAFYYNDKKNIRYPLSDIRGNNQDKRLVVDTDENEDVKVAKMTYVGISRFSSSTIPSNGFFDVTGYIPTPLSRNRYEWWVNGRIVNHDNIIILSPTSFQLKNLRSLKNFELVELVDDVHKSEVMKEGNVYTDINGNTYGSYQLALLSGKTMIDQNIEFVFNASNHKSIHDYTRAISGTPNNIDVEEDIFNTLEQTVDDSDVIKYNELHNLPSINGVTIYNMKSGNFGISELTLETLSSMLDEVWKEEIVTNPLFVTSHKSSMGDDVSIKLHKKAMSAIGRVDNDSFVVYATGMAERYFTLYLTTDPDKKIYNTLTTKKIIPFIKVGTYVVLDKEYEGMWLCCTEPDVAPIKL